MGEEISREEAEALLETRRELGLNYDAALVDSFADRIQKVVEERVQHDRSATRHERDLRRGHAQRQLALGIISLVAAIPVSIVLGVTGNLVALLVAWLGIVAVNLAHAAVGRRAD